MTSGFPVSISGSGWFSDQSHRTSLSPSPALSCPPSTAGQVTPAVPPQSLPALARCTAVKGRRERRRIGGLRDKASDSGWR